MTEILALIVGSVITWLVGEHKEKRDRRRKKKLLLEEVDTNLRMIPQKVGTSQNILDAFSRNQAYPGGGVVKFTTIFYKTHYHEVADMFTLWERNSIHLIYEYLREIDERFDTYAEGVHRAMGTERVDLEVRLAATIIKDLQTVLRVVADLIEKHLRGEPDNVLYEGESVEQLMKYSFRRLRPDPGSK